MKSRSLRFDHLALPARDAAAALEFYTGVLGLELVDALSGDDWNGGPWLMMVFRAGDGRQLALSVLRGEQAPTPSDAEGDVRHFAFSVASESELGAWKRELGRRGVEYREEDHGTQRSIYFRDPTGAWIEITAPPSESVSSPNPEARAVVERWIASAGTDRSG